MILVKQRLLVVSPPAVWSANNSHPFVQSRTGPFLSERFYSRLKWNFKIISYSRFWLIYRYLILILDQDRFSSNSLLDESRNIGDLRQNVIFNFLIKIRFCANCVRSCRIDTSTGFMPKTATTKKKFVFFKKKKIPSSFFVFCFFKGSTHSSCHNEVMKVKNFFTASSFASPSCSNESECAGPKNITMQLFHIFIKSAHLVESIWGM